MNTAVARSGVGREEIRCPSCARLLVWRTGPAIRPHFAHRPRQSCRRRPGASPLRLEQLTLFDPSHLVGAGPAFVVEAFDDDRAGPPRPVPSRRRRRRAWLPRLIRWIKAQANG